VEKYNYGSGRSLENSGNFFLLLCVATLSLYAGYPLSVPVCAINFYVSDRCSCVRRCLVTGPEHKELQVAALADAAQLPQPASAAVDRHAAAEQPHGTVVSDALPHAARLPVTPRLQGVVRQPADRHDRGKPRVQREPHTTTT